MSSMLLLKDHDKNKKDEVISVPYGVGKDLIKRGIAVYWDDGKGLEKVQGLAHAARGGNVHAPASVVDAPVMRPEVPPQPAATTHEKKK